MYGKSRTFIGVPLQVNPQFLRLRKELMEMLGDERISWVDPSRYHITLRFLGDTKTSEIQRIANALGRSVVVPAKQSLQLDRLGYFGGRRQPRVLWVGFENPTLFEVLKRMTENALEICDIQGDEKSFRPHLTLGRIRSRVHLSSFHAGMKKMEDRFREEVFVDRLVFYRSEPGPEGPVYTPLFRMDFRDQAL